MFWLEDMQTGNVIYIDGKELDGRSAGIEVYGSWQFIFQKLFGYGVMVLVYASF